MESCSSLFSKRLTTLLLLLTFSLPLTAQSWRKEIRTFRKELNEHYQNPESSPLNEEDLVDFKGHNFFPMRKKYRVEATIERTPDAQPFIMATVSGKKKTFRKFANLSFTIDGQDLTLAAYRYFDPKTETYSEDLFLPFKDHSSGEESYGGGRYIDLPLPGKQAKTLILDFNQCYNPYCAYSEGWNCPIPPDENHLSVHIYAGTRAWESGH